MNKIHDYQWERIGACRGCHKWFRGIKPNGSRGIAVADYSGEYPHQTCDGVLWLINERHHCIGDALMVSDNDGNIHFLGGTNTQEALWLKKRGLLK